MGIVYPDARRLWAARRRGISFRETATLGRQNLYLHRSEIRQFQRDYLAAYGGSQVPLSSYEFGGWADEFFKSVLGVESLVTIDNSDYEGAGVIHDLNLPLPLNLANRFDVVLDGGTLEHVFNFPVAISNAMRMLRVGGTLFMSTPANNLCGHGFYQFSPELMFRIFAPENGFELREVTLSPTTYFDIELAPIRKTFVVTDPAILRQRVTLMEKRLVLMLVEAVKRADVTPFIKPPQQSDYLPLWDTGRSSSPARGVFKRMFDRLPQIVRNHARGMAQFRRASFWNRAAYTRSR